MTPLGERSAEADGRPAPLGAAWRAVYSLLSPAGGSARFSILIFHRVHAEPDPLFPDEVDARRFDVLCGWLRSWFNVVPLEEGVQRLRAGTLPRRSAAITFDDGYADNHDVALPILKRHGLHATFFIATDFLDGGCMWNDCVVEAIRRSRLDSLDLGLLGLPGLGALDLGTPDSRRQAIGPLLGQLKYLPHERRAEVAARIAGLAQVELPCDLMMDQRRLKAMVESGMDLGGHTASHPILARLDDWAAQREIERGRDALRERTGTAPRLFAYPNGRPERDFIARDVELVRAAGFRAAVTTAPGVCTARHSELMLPRFTPWDRRPHRFAARMAGNLLKA
jgi:peptidoglycan/xylan/chitin deacetylase (PgdA/CDA1 family)